MSRLPNAPLIEVIFELRWTASDQSDHYIHGDFFPLIKEEFPYREQVNPGIIITGIPVPTHRFRREPQGYPLIQTGPGLLTINTIDSKYDWKAYEALIIDTLSKFQKVYTLKESHNIRCVLQYIDLIKFDFEKGDVVGYLKDNLHISINQQFYSAKSPAKNVGLAFSFDDELGSLNMNLGRGKNLVGEDGIAIQTNLTSDVLKPDMNVISQWLDKAHSMTSALFKEMTKGKLQEFFASKK
jgi:uncharacterized protein (TIGR04255 family)